MISSPLFCLTANFAQSFQKPVLIVIPAKAGIRCFNTFRITTFAGGMTAVRKVSYNLLSRVNTNVPVNVSGMQPAPEIIVHPPFRLYS